MFSPAIDLARASAGVMAVFGVPERISAFGDAPQAGAKPYAVFQTIIGGPENYINQNPDADSIGDQVDVYADSMKAAKAGAVALVEAFQGHGHITSALATSRELDTKLWRVTFTVEFKTSR